MNWFFAFLFMYNEKKKIHSLPLFHSKRKKNKLKTNIFYSKIDNYMFLHQPR